MGKRVELDFLTCTTAKAHIKGCSIPPRHGLHITVDSAMLVTSADKGPLLASEDKIIYDAICIQNR